MEVENRGLIILDFFLLRNSLWELVIFYISNNKGKADIAYTLKKEA